MSKLVEEFYVWLKKYIFDEYSIWVFDYAVGGILSLKEVKEKGLEETGIEDGFIIFISPALSTKSKLFVLSHEIGHHFRLPNKRDLKKPDIRYFVRCKKQPEKIADKFATDFLSLYLGVKDLEMLYAKDSERLAKKYADISSKFSIF